MLRRTAEYKGSTLQESHIPPIIEEITQWLRRDGRSLLRNVCTPLLHDFFVVPLLEMLTDKPQEKDSCFNPTCACL